MVEASVINFIYVNISNECVCVVVREHSYIHKGVSLAITFSSGVIH